MKHETTTLNGVEVRHIINRPWVWFVLADVASAIGVSVNGIKKRTEDHTRRVLPVRQPSGVRDMIHINATGLRQWCEHNNGRLAMQKQCVSEWLDTLAPKTLKEQLLDHFNNKASQQATFADPSTIAPTMPLEESTSEAPEAQTIEWRQFWSDEHNGISLRAMVEAGLYSRYEEAVRALKTYEIAFSAHQRKSTGGRPSMEHILTFNDAQRFCARANTPTGRKILDVMIEHHNEYQALLNGDMNAANRLATQIRRAPQGALMTKQAELFLQMCQEQDAMRAQLEELKRRQDELEAGRETPKATNEYFPSQIARRLGWQTSGGNDHGVAINAIADMEGAVEGVDYRMYRMLNAHSSTQAEIVSRLYSEEYMRRFEVEFREAHQRGMSQFTIKREGRPKVNVYCTQYVRQFVQ